VTDRPIAAISRVREAASAVIEPQPAFNSVDAFLGAQPEMRERLPGSTGHDSVWKYVFHDSDGNETGIGGEVSPAG